MNVLVTGGSGYVGSHAVRELAKHKHRVIILDNLSTGHARLSQGFELIEGEISDLPLLAQLLTRVDAVMHFAASAYVGESVANPRKYFRNNVEAALLLLDAVLASPVRMFIFSSSCATYGVPQHLPITEECPQHPLHPYGVTKLFMEQVLGAYSVSSGLRSVSLRYFNAAGAHECGTIGEFHKPETHLIPLTLQAALGIGGPLRIFGGDFDTPDGTCIRDYVHVSDLGEAHVSALEYLASGGKTVNLNLGTGRGTSVNQIATTIEEITGRRVPREIAPRRAGDSPELYADPSKAQNLLAWKPTRDLREILRSAWQWELKLHAADYKLE